MSYTDLAAYVNSTQASDSTFLSACWDEAAQLVMRYIGETYLGEATHVPDDVRSRAILEVGAELFHRRQAPGGITQFATIDGPSPVRMARDPMLPAYPLLDRYVSAGLA